MDNLGTTAVKFHSGIDIPIELHKVRMVQKLHLKPIDERLKAMETGGYNTFLLNTNDLFLDMLTDSGTNAMSDNQISSMLQADDAYSGPQSFYRQVFVNEGNVIPMNYHFTTTKAHMEINGGEI